jgi:hypothetical protein
MVPEGFNLDLPECRPIQGFVLLLDALGAKTFTRDQIQQFVESHRLVVRVLQDVLPAMEARRDNSDTFVGGPARVLAFGDTFAILWPATSRESVAWVRELQEFSAAAAYVMAVAFISGLQLRGAMAVGEFYVESNIAIGPAVADAAEWYEQPQLIGVMATPATQRVISEALSQLAGAVSQPVESRTGRSLTDRLDGLVGDLTRLFWPGFVLPLKDGSTSQQLCLNWPYAMFTLGPEITDSTGEHVSEFFRLKLASRPRPPSAQPKYDNTERFFTHCVSRIDAAERSSLHLKLVRAYNTDVPVAWLSAFVQRYKCDKNGDDIATWPA